MNSIVKEFEQLAYKEFEKYVNDVCVPTLQSVMPVHSGNMRASVMAEKITDTHYRVGTEIHYAEYVQYGRGPVRPKNAKALWNLDGTFGPVKYAGPAKAQHFIEKAIAKLGG